MNNSIVGLCTGSLNTVAGKPGPNAYAAGLETLFSSLPDWKGFRV